MEVTHDPREMRKRLHQAAYGHQRLDGKDVSTPINIAASLIRNVLQMGEAYGYSGEDTMTILAYHALLGYEKSQDMCLEFYNINPNTPIIFTPKTG